MSDIITIHRRFCGPPASGNGGYTCGIIAKHCAGPVSVRLLAPPPLDTAMRFTKDEKGGILHLGDTIIAKATPKQWDLDIPPPPSLDEAKRAQAAYPGFHDHALPGCFVCGPARKVHDGLRIFAGQVPNSQADFFAASWDVDADLGDSKGTVKSEFIWAALDCPGYFAVQKNAGFALLGDFSVTINRAAQTGETLVISAWPIQSDGRKHRAGSALYTAQGTCIAHATATWISVPKEAYVAATS